MLLTLLEEERLRYQKNQGEQEKLKLMNTMKHGYAAKKYLEDEHGTHAEKMSQNCRDMCEKQQHRR